MRSGFIAAVSLIVLAVGTGAWLWLDRARTLDAGERSAHALVRVLEEQTARGLQAVDLTLTGIIDALALAPGLGEHNPAFEDTMRERLKSLPLVGALFVIGPDGFITQDTNHPNTPRINLADRDYFMAHAADPSLATRIGKPLISRSAGGWFISVSRRITRPDGSFGGVAVAAVMPRYFERFYRELDLGDHDRVALFRRDGILLVGTPYNDEEVGKDYSALDLFPKHLPGKADGTYRTLSAFDQTPRIISYRSVSGFPLVVAVALAEGDLLAGWRRNAVVTTATGGLVAILTILLVTLWVRRQTEREQALQRQTEAREQLVRHALKMATVLESTTDAVIELDRNWRVTFMNERARSLFPDHRDVTGQILWEAYPELVGTYLWQRYREIMDANAPSEFEIAGPLTGHWYFARAFPSRDGLAVFFQDVTARRQAEQERERLAQELEKERTLLKGVLAHLPLGVLAAAAPEGRILLHNAAAERLLGHPVHIAQSVDGYAAYGAVHPDGSPYRPEEYPLARVLLHGETIVQEEMLYHRGDGSLSTFTVSAAPVQDSDGRTVMAVSTFQDISERKRMEVALRRSEERLALALRSGQAGTFDVDLRTGRAVWSEENYRLFGLEPGQSINIATWFSLLHPEDRERMLAEREQFIREARSDYDLEYRVLRPDGSVRWILNRGRFTYGEDGVPLRSSGLCVDVTERREAEEALRRSEERLNFALACAGAGIWDWNIRTGELSWSEGVYALHGLSPERFMPSYEAWLPCIHPDDRENIQHVVRTILASPGNDYTVEHRILHPERGERWLMNVGRIVRHRDGSPLRLTGVSIDITERKRMEEDLRAAKQEAERASLAKTKFLAAASHDLRQPLQSLFLFAAALHAQVQTERGRKALDTLERNLEVLRGLMDSLFDVSRLDAEVIRPTVEDFLLAPVLDHIGASFAPVARSKGLDFGADVPRDVAVRSDRHLLGRMIRNLVENAIKYTEKGAVRLECRIVGDHASIAVHDTGIGIAPDQQEAIFVEFHQVGNPERDRAKGLGLGLSIVQRLAKLLDHPVSVQSAPGQGSVFTVDVPLGETDAVHTPESFAAIAPDGGGRLAVLIDDEADVLLGLRGIFRDWGYDTVTGASAERALERLRADGRTPAVVVSDYRLAENRTGVEAVRLVREHVGAAVPGVILTGDTEPNLRAEAVKEGLGIVIKPVAPRQLHEALKRLLGEAA
ncbi:MAG TPA: PAS domain-containing protein [Azospirillum sp.]|nr:PAS domain-containing protein [Azospirillum sp.]